MFISIYENKRCQDKTNQNKWTCTYFEDVALNFL